MIYFFDFTSLTLNNQAYYVKQETMQFAVNTTGTILTADYNGSLGKFWLL